MIEHIVPQQVILPGALVRKLVVAEAQVTIGVEADRDAQSVRRHEAFVAVLADDLKPTVAVGGHVESAVAQGVKLPIAAAAVVGQLARHGIYKRLQSQWKVDTEKIGGDPDALIVEDLLAGDGIDHGIAPVVNESSLPQFFLTDERDPPHTLDRHVNRMENAGGCRGRGEAEYSSGRYYSK